MQTFSNTTQFKINPDVVYTCIDDEAVIMGIQMMNYMEPMRLRPKYGSYWSLKP